MTLRIAAVASFSCALVLSVLPCQAGTAYQATTADYVAVEAENADSLGGSDWRIVYLGGGYAHPNHNVANGTTEFLLPPGTDASGSGALLADFGQGTADLAIFKLHFAAAGTYRWYIRDSAFQDGNSGPTNYGNEDSVYRPNTFDAAPNTTYHGYSGGKEGDYAWRNTGMNFTAAAPGDYEFRLRPRETGFSIDRIVFSTSTGLSSDALDALVNSALDPTHFTDADGADSNWSTAGNWDNGVPTALNGAFIGGGNTADLSAAGQQAMQLTIGHDEATLGGSGTLNQTAGDLTISDSLIVGTNGTTGTYTVSGGSLTVGAALARADLIVGMRTRNMSAATEGTIDMTGGGPLTVYADRMILGYQTQNASGGGGGTVSGTLTLPASATIDANQLILGTIDSGNIKTTTGTMHLGASTTIATPFMAVGYTKGTGVLDIAAGGTLALGSAGARTDLLVGVKGSGTSSNCSGTMDVRDGTTTAFLHELSVGRSLASSPGKPTGTLRFGAGTVDVNDVRMADMADDTATLQLVGTTMTVNNSVIGGAGSSTLLVDEGTMTVANGLTVGTLRVGLALDPGGVAANLTVQGGAVAIGGSGAGPLDIGLRPEAFGANRPASRGVADFSAARGVAIDATAIRIGVINGNLNREGQVYGDLILSASGTNTVTADSITIGDSPARGNSSDESTVQLGGAANTINTDLLRVGYRKSTATMDIDAGGTLTLGGKSGAAADLDIGINVDGTGTKNDSFLDLTGGTFNATLDQVRIGKQNAGGGNGYGTLIVDAGTIIANGVQLATGSKSKATIIQRGGSVTVANNVTDGSGGSKLDVRGNVDWTVGGTTAIDTIAIGQTTGSKIVGTLNLDAGDTVTASSIIIGDSTSAGQDANPGDMSSLNLLAAANVIRANTIIIGGRKSVGQLTVPNGSTLDIAGRTNAEADLYLGRNNYSTATHAYGEMDLSGAASFNAVLDDLVLGQKSGGNNGDAVGRLTLAATNTITADTILIGDSENGGQTGASKQSSILLGASNTIGVNTMTIGGRKTDALVAFQAGGVLNLGTQADPVSDLRIGYNNVGTGTNTTGHLDETGGTINAYVDNVVLGLHGRDGGSGTGILTLTDGTFVATDILMGVPDNLGNSSNDANTEGIINLQGGVLSADTIRKGGGTATFDFTGGMLHVDSFQFDLPQDGGTLAPGRSIGTTVLDGTYAQNAGVLQIEIGGTAGPGVDPDGWDQLIVNGDITLAGALELLFTNGYDPAEMDSWLILLNDGTDTTGPFPDLPEGTVFYNDGASRPLQITYLAGDGNDVALQAVPEPATMALLGLAACGLGSYLRRRRTA